MTEDKVDYSDLLELDTGIQWDTKAVLAMNSCIACYSNLGDDYPMLGWSHPRLTLGDLRRVLALAEEALNAKS